MKEVPVPRRLGMVPRVFGMSTAWLLLVGSTMLFSRTQIDAGSTVERTLAMIKPDGVRANHTEAIKKIIQAEGFEIVAEKEALLDETAAQLFYKEHSGRSFYRQLVDFMTSGPVLALVLERQNAIKEWRALMGPTDSNKARLEAPNRIYKFYAHGGPERQRVVVERVATRRNVVTQDHITRRCVRSKFGVDGQSNCVHGSDSPEAAAREIASFFDVITPEERAELTTSTHDEL